MSLTPGQGVKIPRVSGPKTQNRSNVVTNAIKTLTSIIEKESSDKWLEPSNREAGQRKGPGHWLTRTSQTPWCMTVLLGEKIHFRLYINKEPHSCVRNGVPLEDHKGTLCMKIQTLWSSASAKGRYGQWNSQAGNSIGT